MRRRVAAIAGFVVLAIAGAACADDGTASGSATTSTSSSTTTTTTIGDACAIPVPDTATQLALLDVDQDGSPDEMLVSESTDGHRLHVALSAGTAWADVPGGEPPRLLDRPTGGAAARDLDGDGLLDLFLAPMSTNGAELVRVAICGGTVDEIGQHRGEWCIRDGGFHCERRIACVGDAVISDMTSGGDIEGLDEGEWRWGRTETTIRDGELVTVPLASVEYELANPPPGVPTTETTGVVDCSPERDADIADIADPTDPASACADPGLGHGASPAEIIGEVDLDGDEFVDRLYAWSSSGSGAGTLALVIGAGTTNAVYFPDWDQRPELLATHDFDADGTAELLVSVSGEEHTAVALRLDGCRLEKLPLPHEVPLTDPNDSSVGEFRFDVTPSACEFEGCAARATCLGEELVLEVTYFLDHRNPQFDPENPDFTWLLNRYRIEDGQWVDTHPDGRGDPADVQPPSFVETGGGLFC